MVIGLVIPVYNNSKLTTECLDSLIANQEHNPSFGIIVVDDGSTDDTQIVLEAYKDIHKLKNDTNLGYLDTTNKGIQYARDVLDCDFILLMNNDLIFDADWLANLIKYSEQFDIVGYFSHTKGLVSEAKQTKFLEFSCVCISKKVFEEIGQLDSRYKMGYYSDDDYCLRALVAGFSLGVIPNTPAKVTHLCGQTFGETKRKELIIDMYSIFADKWKQEAKTNNTVKDYIKNVVYNPNNLKTDGVWSKVTRNLSKLIK